VSKFTFTLHSDNGLVRIVYEPGTVEDPDNTGEYYTGAKKPFSFAAGDYRDVEAMGAAIEPYVMRMVAPGVLTAVENTQMCLSIAKIQWQFRVDPDP